MNKNYLFLVTNSNEFFFSSKITNLSLLQCRICVYFWYLFLFRISRWYPLKIVFKYYIWYALESISITHMMYSIHFKKKKNFLFPWSLRWKKYFFQTYLFKFTGKFYLPLYEKKIYFSKRGEKVLIEKIKKIGKRSQIFIKEAICL